MPRLFGQEVGKPGLLGLELRHLGPGIFLLEETRGEEGHEGGERNGQPPHGDAQ